jgi:histidinol dehydrogenase
MKITRLSSLNPSQKNQLMNRAEQTYEEILPGVSAVMQDVKTRGDDALYEKNWNRFGKKNFSSLLVSSSEIQKAYKQVDPSIISALTQMIKNIKAVHKAQLPTKKDTIVYPERGIRVWREWRPITSVGLYIPGGKAIYPSSVLMSAIPAQIAGCSEIILCSPAKDMGQIPAVTLVAADMIGLKKIYKIGGAESIAAMTYGTKTIPKVYKIFGAGNSSVTAAKLLARSTVSIDMPAGPSEVLIIADNTANPSYIAADLLADGEHGEDSACVLITTSIQIAQQTIREIKRQLRTLSTKEYAQKSLQNYGLIGVADSIEEAVSFTNRYAPEHLEIMTKNPLRVASDISSAGSVFIGDWTCKSSGDYATGANHVLPTGGMAMMYPPLGVDSYGKWMQLQQVTRGGLRRIQNTIETIATAEQLPAHKRSVSIRFERRS